MTKHSEARLESRILEAISTMVVTGAIKNPHLSPFTSITEVRLSVDNAYATVFVSTVMEKDLERSVKALSSASGFIQGRLGAILKTRNTPVLRFVADRSYQEGERINHLIDEALGKA